MSGPGLNCRYRNDESKNNALWIALSFEVAQYGLFFPFHIQAVTTGGGGGGALLLADS